jgi:hypothetical protein
MSQPKNEREKKNPPCTHFLEYTHFTSLGQLRDLKVVAESVDRNPPRLYLQRVIVTLKRLINNAAY